MSRIDRSWWSLVCLLLLVVGPNRVSQGFINVPLAPEASLGSTPGSTPCHTGEAMLPDDLLVIDDSTNTNLEVAGPALPQNTPGVFGETRSQRIIQNQGALIRGTIGTRAIDQLLGFEVDASRTNEITLIDPNHPCEHHANSSMTLRPIVICVISGITLNGSISQASGAASISAFQGTDETAPVEKFATLMVVLTEDRRPHGKHKTIAEVTKNGVTSTFEPRFGVDGDFVVDEGTDPISYDFTNLPFTSFARNGFTGVANPVLVQASETLVTRKLNKKADGSYASADCKIVVGNVPELSDNEESINLP